ncbi:unnamed protein product [Rotaria sp. Silwood2]|nr:unnamed protein product [Rotaria sp. Silwood2]CAF4531299.1 unnamed protein product [Rotaria sp. Silwood2]
MATTTRDTCFLTKIPFSLFNINAKQYSLRNLSEGSKTFLWHQFMLNVLLSIPRSPTAIDDAITGFRLLSETDPTNDITLGQNEITQFQTIYTPDNAIHWFSRSSFFYHVLNKACRMLNNYILVQFHSIINNIDTQLKQLHLKQIKDGTLVLPLTVYREQTQWDATELEKLHTNIGDLKSMNTFLSTTVDYDVATIYATGDNRHTFVLFKITVNKIDTINDKQCQTFADISQYSAITDEKEILFIYKKEGRIKELIDKDSNLQALAIQTNTNATYSINASSFICLLFDLLNSFLYHPDKKKPQE